MTLPAASAAAAATTLELAMAMDPLTLIKVLQLLPMGLGGVAMATDCLHGKVSGDMGPKMGFPRWFPTALGLWKLAFVYANWADDGAHAPLAQAMMAFHTGGATYAHVVGEGKPAAAAGSCVLFWALSVAAQVTLGTALPTAAVGHAALAAVGFGTGYIVSALGPGKTKTKTPNAKAKPN